VKKINKIIEFLEKYHKPILTITAMIGVLFGLSGLFLGFNELKQCKKDNYLRHRPFVNLKEIQISSRTINLEIENGGLTIARSVNLKFSQKVSYESKEKEPLLYNLTVGPLLYGPFAIGEIECSNITIIGGWAGQLSPNNTREIRADFCQDEQLEKIKVGAGILVIEIDYGDYKDVYRRHSYQLRFNKEAGKFYIIEESEKIIGKDVPEDAIFLL